MLKHSLPILVFLALSAQTALAERISCMRYLVSYAGRTQDVSATRLEPWLSRLRDTGLGELAALVEQKKIMVRETDKEDGESIQWRTTLLRTVKARGYMLILNRQAVGEDSQSFWKFANALYEIYFFRSLWGLPQDFWDDTKFGLQYFFSHAPAYFESLQRLTPRMYALYQTLEESERGSLPKRQVSEPGVIGQSLRYGSGSVDNQLNQRDLQTFLTKGEARLQDVLKNRLEPRVIIGHYAGYSRKALLVTALYAALMASYQAPQQIHMMQVMGSAIYQSTKTLVSNPKDVEERYINHMRLAYDRQILRRDELKAQPSLTSEEQEELKDVEAEIQAILEDVPELKKE